MQFNVEYVPYKIPFCGDGSVFLNETALIFEGSVKKINIPVLYFWDLYHNFLVKTIRTVPYSTILNYKKVFYSPVFYYKKRKPVGNCYQINYRLPDGKKTGIKFIYHQNKSNNKNIFLMKLEEHMNAIKKI
ncbi:hypothetical protein [Moorena sp. SIO3H5]|uniref:hypothetical protein n=1 Tax=Moorena sp. SIO3H5 TaxID=2607834 RepID=UPI0013B7BBD9|nr:hypothetical protein [Moorena sp. SIO3H5]NEO72630.1 hypothetical protein [Moorena sp. SIO3H5]